MEQNSDQQDFREYTDTPASSNNIERPIKTNAFMMLSLVMGILAFTSCTFIFVACIAGGLSILFAILSKGNHPKMHFLAKSGITASVAAMVLSVIITSSMVYLVFHNTQYREMLNTTYESMYGITFDEAMENVYPSIKEGESHNAGN